MEFLKIDAYSQTSTCGKKRHAMTLSWNFSATSQSHDKLLCCILHGYVQHQKMQIILYFFSVPQTQHFTASSQEMNSCSISIKHKIFSMPSHIRDLDITLFRWKIQVRVSMSDTMHVFHCMSRMTRMEGSLYMTMMS